MTLIDPNSWRPIADELRRKLAAGDSVEDALRAVADPRPHGLIFVCRAVREVCGISQREAARTVAKALGLPRLQTPAEEFAVSSSTRQVERLPDLQELIRVARAYVAGRAHFSYVCSAAAALRDESKMYSLHSRIRQFVSDWSEMSSRVWPEMGRVANPISEAEFKQWVQSQLAVFEPGDEASDDQGTGSSGAGAA